ncbi:galactose oxidase/kelch repeat superfamily protein [Wolffia australiana]
MGKKAKKAGKGKEKTERKTAKAEEKRARRECKKLSEEDDIDAILLKIQKEEAKKTEVHVEDNVPGPSPRSNSSLNVNPSKASELILYGGEFYNGQKTFVYGDLYRYDVDKNEWKSISSPNSPPPRSAHQAVAWKDHMYIYGGEFTSPNQERFHHYKDFWRLDLKSNQWEQLVLKGCPSPRSGHRMVLHKHKIIIFGGFYDTLREVRYFNDLHIFDLDLFKWQEIKPKLGSLWPSARSGFQLFPYQDEVFLYGGYSKEISADKSGSEKGVVHHDMWALDTRTWEWRKVKKAGMPPGPRAGFSMGLHKKRALLFGGVVDMEVSGDEMMSLFMNELYGFQLDTNRWYPLELRKNKAAKDKPREPRRPPDGQVGFTKEDASVLEDFEMNDVDDQRYDDNDDVSLHMDKSLSLSNGSSSTNLLANVQPEKEMNAVPETVKPCGRINACMVVSRDTLYVYGGMMEIKDREVTLDDLYMLNLNKLDEWKCIIPASTSEWLEVSDDNDDEDEDEDDNDDSQSEDDGAESDDDGVGLDGGVSSMNTEDAVAILKGESKNLRRKEKRLRIEQIRVTLGLSDSQRTPMPGETLRDFYKRTSLYWQMAAHEHTQHTGKELRKDGFDLADARYKELKPVLDELAVLEADQKAEEEESVEGSSKKNNKNTTRHSSRR